MDDDGSPNNAVDAGRVKTDLTIEDNDVRCAPGNNQTNFRILQHVKNLN